MCHRQSHFELPHAVREPVAPTCHHLRLVQILSFHLWKFDLVAAMVLMLPRRSLQARQCWLVWRAVHSPRVVFQSTRGCSLVRACLAFHRLKMGPAKFLHEQWRLVDKLLRCLGIILQWTAEARARSIGQARKPQLPREHTARAHVLVWISAMARIRALLPVHRTVVAAAAMLAQRDRILLVVTRPGATWTVTLREGAGMEATVMVLAKGLVALTVLGLTVVGKVVGKVLGRALLRAHSRSVLVGRLHY